jgi:regulator of replication initiation timing
MSKPGAKAPAAGAPPAPDPSLAAGVLRAQLSQRTDEILGAKLENEALRRRVAELSAALADSESSGRDVAEEGARRAKEREDSLGEQVRSLEAEVARLRALNAEAVENVLDQARAYEAKLKAKGAECAALRSRIDDLAAEFGDMLQALQQKMQERVRLVEPTGADGSAEGQARFLTLMKEAVPL